MSKQETPSSGVTCKACGQSGLKWFQNKAGKWYLAASFTYRSGMPGCGSYKTTQWVPHFKKCR